MPITWLRAGIWAISRCNRAEAISRSNTLNWRGHAIHLALNSASRSGKLKGEEARDETSESKALSAEPDAPGPASEDAGFSQVSDLPPLAEEGIGAHLDALALSRNRGPKSDAPMIATATLAELYASQGLVQEAIAVLEQMVARDPDNEQVIARLDELRNLPE